MRQRHLGFGLAFVVLALLAATGTAAAATARASASLTIYDGPTGWVLGSYLIGSAAKVDATPSRPLVNPFRIIRPRPFWQP